METLQNEKEQKLRKPKITMNKSREYKLEILRKMSLAYKQEIKMGNSNIIIKFRAWDEYQKKMLGWADVTDPMKLTLSNLLNGLIDHLKPMRYTGLKDKTSKEIYEGDIRKGKYFGDDCFWIVTFGMDRNGNGHGFVAYPQLENINRMSYNKFYMTDREGLSFGEIIGNIYENPDLLKL